MLNEVWAGKSKKSIIEMEFLRRFVSDQNSKYRDEIR